MGPAEASAESGIPSAVRAVFFDAGHTLVTPRVPVPEVYYHVATELGVDLDVDAFRAELSQRWSRLASDYRTPADLRSSEQLERQSWHRFTADVAAAFPQLAAIHQTWFERLFAYFNRPQAWEIVPQAEMVLETLEERGLALGVISNWHGAVRDILDELGLTRHLRVLITSAEVGYRKPHRLPFETALARTGLRAEQVLHVGDSWAEDVRGAQAVGMRAVWLAATTATMPEESTGARRISRLGELLEG